MWKFIENKKAINILLLLTIINTIVILVLLIVQRNFKEVIDLIGIYLTAFLGGLVYNSQVQKDKVDYTMQRPLLNFVYTPSFRWVILNVGNGPALNIRFMGNNNVSWVQPVIGYAIPPNMALTIADEIKNDGAALAVYYKDLFENEYMVHCEGDTNSIVSKKGDKNWDEELYKKIHHDVRRSTNLHLTSLK